MSSGRIHPGGIPLQTLRAIDARLEELPAANQTKLASAGFWRRCQLRAELEDQAFFEITHCHRSVWEWRCSGGPVIN